MEKLPRFIVFFKNVYLHSVEQNGKFLSKNTTTSQEGLDLINSLHMVLEKLQIIINIFSNKFISECKSEYISKKKCKT